MTYSLHNFLMALKLLFSTQTQELEKELALFVEYFIDELYF